MNILLFIFVCMTIRILAVYLAYKDIFLQPLGVLYILFGLGIATIYIFKLRDVGIETGGKKIWWDKFRLLFALIWISFGIAALQKKRYAWKILTFDIIAGYSLFINHHFL